MGYSVLAYFRIRWKHSHLHTVFWIAGDITFDAPFVFNEVAPYDGIIFTFRCLVEELQTEFCFGISGLGDDEQARCVLVDAVNESDFGVVDIEFGFVLEVPSQGIEQCAMPVAKTRMHHQAWLLVHHDEIIVLIDDVDRNIFSCDFVFIVRTVEHHLDDVAWLHLVAALHGFVICHDKPCIGSFLNAVA